MLSCRQILNIMVIFGFMFNYMLRVNLTIAIVDMVVSNDSSHLNSTNHTNASQSVSRTDETRFNWSSEQYNAILGKRAFELNYAVNTRIILDVAGSFFWGYVLTELPGGRMAEKVGARKIFGGGMLMASILTVLTPAAAYLHYYVILILRAVLGFFLGATWPAIPPMAAKWIPPMERLVTNVLLFYYYI